MKFDTLPLSLYVHLPWCVRKCPYCDFNSYTAGDNAPRARYLNALMIDLKIEAVRAAGRPLCSVFLGGGTPSLFTPDEIGRLLAGVHEHFELPDGAEVTMEANPGTVECGDPTGYRQAGVNRLSIGAQSFQHKFLQVLGRIHTVDDVRRAVAAAQSAGFANINLDVMYALPGQTVADAEQDLHAAVALQPTHISWYQLTLEPNTVFHARPPTGLPDDDLCEDIHAAGQKLLQTEGFRQYEVSAYARDEHRCTHNLNYWSFGDYLAVGAGAHGKFTTATRIARYAKPANPHTYMEALENGGQASELHWLQTRDRVFEFMLNALRLTDGLDTRLFEERTGLCPTMLEEPLARLQKRKLIDRIYPDSWRVTGLGQRFLNDLQAEFLP